MSSKRVVSGDGSCTKSCRKRCQCSLHNKIADNRFFVVLSLEKICGANEADLQCKSSQNRPDLEIIARSD